MIYGAITARLLSLRPGQCCVVANKGGRIDYSQARKQAPDREWRGERRDGVWVVTRVR